MTTGTENLDVEGAIRSLEQSIAHLPTLVQTKHVRGKVHGESAIGHFNAAVAVRITSIVGTMYCAYVFALLALVALPTVIASPNITTAVNWLSSNFLQLVLLPIIIVGQNVISTAQDARAEADHKTLTALHLMNVQQLKLLEQQQQILDMLKPRAAG